ncbi:hypothetical protein CsatB_013336 [Cannabis sativa]
MASLNDYKLQPQINLTQTCWRFSRRTCLQEPLRWFQDSAREIGLLEATWIPRSCNTVANKLAKWALLFKKNGDLTCRFSFVCQLVMLLFVTSFFGLCYCSGYCFGNFC